MGEEGVDHDRTLLKTIMSNDGWPSDVSFNVDIVETVTLPKHRLERLKASHLTFTFECPSTLSVGESLTGL